jgi:hypothetical protein
MIQRTAHQWAKQFSVLDLRASSCPDLKCLTTLMEHDVQVMRWKQAPRGSMAEADAVKREREAFDKLNVQYTQMGGDLVRMFPTVRVVAEAIGQTLDRKLENAMAALREISSARALVAHEYEPSADELGHQPASGHLDILPVRVMAKKTEGEADQSDERNQIVAQAKTRRAVP